MKTVTQSALAVVSERIKPFSSRLELLSMKLADFVRLTVCSIGQAMVLHIPPRKKDVYVGDHE